MIDRINHDEPRLHLEYWACNRHVHVELKIDTIDMPEAVETVRAMNMTVPAPSYYWRLQVRTMRGSERVSTEIYGDDAR